MINPDNIAIFQQDETIPQINRCAEIGCHACCSDMIKSMTFEELRYYTEGIRAIPVTDELAFQTLSIDENLEPGIYYLTNRNHNPKSRSSFVSIEENFIRNPRKFTKVLIVGACHHLMGKKGGVKTCGAYGTESRPACCEKFAFAGERCNLKRMESGLSVIEA